jgi:arylsulfatase
MGGLSVVYGILPPLPTITRLRFSGDVQNIQRGMTPRIQGRSYAIEAQLHLPGEGAEGVIVANADFIGGYALWVDNQRLLHHTYSFLGVDTFKQVSSEPIPTGDVKVKMLFEIDEAKPGKGGKVTLWADDAQIGEGRLDHTVPIAFTSYSGMDIGRDNGLVVDLDYEDKAPYAFTGIIGEVVFDLAPGTHADEISLHKHAAHHAVAAGVAG